MPLTLIFDPFFASGIELPAVPLNAAESETIFADVPVDATAFVLVKVAALKAFPERLEVALMAAIKFVVDPLEPLTRTRFGIVPETNVENV